LTISKRNVYLDATEIWKTAGKPRSGEINATRLRCKYQYKKAIKETAEIASSELNDNLYSHLCNKDNVGFWKAWRKRFCSHNIKPTGQLNGQLGDANIRQVFTEHFKSLYQPNTPNADLEFAKKFEVLLNPIQQWVVFHLLILQLSTTVLAP